MPVTKASVLWDTPVCQPCNTRTLLSNSVEWLHPAAAITALSDCVPPDRALLHVCHHRNQAILLDSDSDGMDSEDEHSEMCSTDSDDNLSRGGSLAADSFTNAPSRSTPSVTQSNRTTPRPTSEITAAAKKQLQKRASSKRARQSRSNQPKAGQPDDGLIKANYPSTPESLAAAAAAAAKPGAGGLAAVKLKGGASRRALPIALRYHGAILSDSDSDDEGLPAAQADKSALLAAGHVDSAAPAPATATVVAAPAPAVPKPVVLIAPPSRGKAAAVRQAVAGAAQAAGRAIAAAQAGAAASGGSAAGFRQPGVQVVVPADTDTVGRSSSPIVLTPPKRSAFTAALGADVGAGGDGSPRTAATVSDPQQAATAGARGAPKPAAGQWEPAFSQAGAGEQQQQGGSWAEGGWSNVAL